MRDYSKAARFFAAFFVLLLVYLSLTGNTKTDSSRAPIAKQIGAPIGSPEPASLKFRSTQTTATEEAMAGSQPAEIRWADIACTKIEPLQEAKEEEEDIYSDIDPETLRKLKRMPFQAPSSMPSAYRADDDSAAEAARQPSPLAPNLPVNFESIDNGDQLDGFLHRPPDCAMAAGQNHVIAAVNSMFVIYSKTGSILSQASMASFFSLVCTNCASTMTDPRVVYDSQAGRWIMMILNGNQTTTNVSNYLVAVSQTSDPTGSWWLYSLNGVLTYPPTAENTWADFPSLGFDGIASGSGGAVYITSNQFTFGSPAFRTAMLNILPKSSLYSGAALSYWRAWDRLNSDSSQAFTLSSALTYGNPGGELLINSKNGGTFVSMWKVIPTFPPTAVNWTLQSTNSIGTYSIPPDAAQPGACALMATNDSRISSNASWRNNKLCAVFSESHDWGGGGGTVSAIRYVQINTSTNATEQNVTFGADGFHYFFPAVANDSLNNVVLTFARSSSSEFGSIRYTGRLATDPVNTFQGSALLRAGNLCITGGRWGDYFTATVDGFDASKVWIYGAWAADVVGVSLPWDWGTWIGQVQFVTTSTLTIASSNPNSAVSITVSPNDNNGQGNGVSQFTRVYNNNTSVTLTAPSTAAGNNFEKWQRDGVDFATTTTTNVTMDANHTMTAVYITTRTLTVASSNPSSGVSVTVSPNDNNAQGNGVTQFARVYDNSTVVTLTAPSTAGGNNFQKWQRDGVDVAITTTTNVTMDADHVMTALYVTPRTLTVASTNPSSGVGMTVSPNDNNAQGSGVTQFTRIYNNNTVVTLTAPSTAAGNNFQKWQRDGADFSFSQATNVTMDANHTMTAVYIVELLSETFSAGIPPTWTIVDGGSGGGAAAMWTTANPGNRSIGGPFFTAPFAIVDSNSAGQTATQDEQLITPAINASTCSGRVVVEFSNQFFWYDQGQNEVADVDVSTNGGSTWTNVHRMRGEDNGYPIPIRKTIDITSAIGSNRSNVKIRFHYYNASFEWWWAIDNVKVKCVSGPPHNASTTGVFRPSNATFYLKNSNSIGFADTVITYGSPGDYPVVGDWNGDGIDTIGVYRNGTFYLRNSNTIGFADIVVPFGQPGDQPIVGDWDGDGIDTIGVFRNGNFMLRNSNTPGPPDIFFGLGGPGDVAIAGDWDGDGIDTTGVYRPSNGALYLKFSNTTGFADLVLTYGSPGDKPIVGDWDGDGVDTIGIYRFDTFFLRNSNSNGFGDIVFTLGSNGDMPISGDWDGLP